MSGTYFGVPRKESRNDPTLDFSCWEADHAAWMALPKGIPRRADHEDESAKTTSFWAGRIGRLFIGSALCAAFAAYIFVTEGTVALAVVVGGVAVALSVHLVRRRAGRAISTEVQGDPPAAGRVATSPPDAAAAAPAAVEPAGSPLPFAVDVVQVTSMPAVSAQSRARFEVIQARGARLRGLYRWAVLVLALVSTALAFAASRVFPDVSFFPYATPIFLALTLSFLAYDAVKWRRVERHWDSGRNAAERSVPARWRDALTAAADAVTSVIVDNTFKDLLSTLRRARGGSAAERDRWESEVVPLQPVLVPLLGAAWLAISAVEALAYINPSGIVFIVPIALYLVALRRGKAKLVRQYPVQPPLNLLTLRVFSSPSLQDFILMTDGWRWLGPMQRLDGSDTAGNDMRDVIAYLRGDIKDVIVEDEAELTEALADFRNTPDGQLRYPSNSIQCNDVTWKQALQTLLDDADAVVIDLSGFNEERRGAAYEIGQLIDQIPCRRFILLVNQDTDMTYLRRVLHDAWVSMPDGSPNAATGGPVHILEIPALETLLSEDTSSERTEQVATWVESQRLVAALIDAAGAGREGQAARVLPWARSGLPRFFSFL